MANKSEMKLILAALIACVLPLSSPAQDALPVMLRFPKNDVRELLLVYERLTGKPVYISIHLQALVTIGTEKPIPPADAIELIRSTLLERYGIELRTTDRGETLVEWSKDPKYPRRSAPPEGDTLPKTRMRIIK